ncbi:MAG: hypothetical protein KUG71_01325 [Porticoccaceae bacterium]|nr:hypothetical protein [Porticoccaceae bacterium]
MINNRSTSSLQGKQAGAVLLLSLILLLALTAIGISTMQGTVFEEKMAGNTRDWNFAYQAGENALRDGELWLDKRASQPEANSSGSNGVWGLKDIGTGSWWTTQSGSWWGSNAVTLSGIANLEAQPRRIIEEDVFLKDSLGIGQQQTITGLNFYRVTARATGGTDRSVVKLQSMYARRF